jgi:hypothetical protein
VHCEKLGKLLHEETEIHVLSFKRIGTLKPRANFNVTVDPTVRDPIIGTPTHRANLCEVRLVAAP